MKNMMKILTILILCAGVISVSGCKTYSPYTISMYGDNMYFSPKRPEAVRVFYQKPPGDYIEMGEITVHDVWSMSRAMDLLRAKTAELGGDAIYIISTIVIPDNDYPFRYGVGYGHHDPHSWGYGFGAYDYPENELTVTGVVIRYR